MQKSEPPLSEISEIPQNDLANNEMGSGYNASQNLWEVIVKYNGNIKKIEKELGVEVEVLSPNYAIVTLSPEKITPLSRYSEIEYLEQPKNLGLMLSRSMPNACITSVQTDPAMPLTGEGVIVAIIDSGIDYTHPDFINDDGTTRILKIWDQSANGNPPKGFTQGTEYTSEQINEALKNNDKTIVPHEDTIGHGTAVAGAAAGNGRASKGKYIGAAPKASLLIVKLGRKGYESFARTTEMMRALKYIIDTATQLNMPVSINISFGSNNGAHDGRSLFETYIDEVSWEWKNVIVVASGNEGGAGHHFSGNIQTGQTVDIEFAVYTGIKAMFLVCWKPFVDILSFELIAPSGKSTGVVNFTDRLRRFALGSTVVYAFHGQPSFYNGDQEIYFQLINKDGYIEEGVWTLRVKGLNVVVGTFDVWLPITEAVTNRTAFLKPDKSITLTLPSTTDEVITVGGYNSDIDSIADFSGRGYTRRYNVVKPDLVAPAVNILTPSVGGSYDSFTGTSIAAPHVTGGAALLMEWGIVKGNNPYLYGQRLKSYLQLGARRKPDIKYPNNEWGYGRLCIKNSIDFLKEYNYFSEISSETLKLTKASIDKFFMKKLKNIELATLEKENQNYGVLAYDVVNSTQTKTFMEDIVSEEYIDIIVKYTPYVEQLVKTKKYIAAAIVLSENFAIIYVKLDQLRQFSNEVQGTLISEDVTVLGLMGRRSLEASGILTVQNQPYLNLTGTNVLIGLIDTGIDYTNKAFIYEDGTSKIQYIWDQTIQGNAPDGFYYGTEYTNSQINEALASEQPLSVVPHKDEVGHGTFLASVAASREQGEYIGAAPDSDIVMVKLKQTKDFFRKAYAISQSIENAYSSSDIMIAIEYLQAKAQQLNKPIAICIGLGTNSGPHNGFSLFEEYIAAIASKSAVAMCVAAGNESNTRHHTQGKIAKTGEYVDVEIKVGEGESGFTVFFYNYSVDRISASVTSPTGEIVPRMPLKDRGYYENKLVFEKSVVTTAYYFLSLRSVTQTTNIRITDPTPGIWKVRLFGDSILEGDFYGWLPIRDFITPDTYFLVSTPDYTITVPGTTKTAITCGAYNDADGSIYISSSRGGENSLRRLPDLVAPGVSVSGIYPSGYGNMTGTSVAAAITTGASALMLQWGIIDGNKQTMNTTTIKGYLIRGCRRRENLEYHNNIWGYGELDLFRSFQAMRGV